MPDAPLPVFVADSSPLIILAKAGLAFLLEVVSSEVCIPETVRREIEAGADDDPARALLASGFSVPVPDAAPNPAVEAFHLDAGETAAVSFALEHPKYIVLLDDRAGKRACAALGVSAIGTLGVILRAKAGGHVSDAAPLFRDVQATGLYFSDDLARQALAGAGEVWP